MISERFVPVAENCSPLQRAQQDAKGEFFRYVAEQGHYAGRTIPSASRQGLYAFKADGTLLASVNTREARPLLGMLDRALERWEDDPHTGAGTPETYDPDPNYRSRYPEGGLVLLVTTRDLPREVDTRPDDLRRRAFNHDYAWFTRDEAASIVPADPRVGQRVPLPWPIVRRIARFHLLDSTRGETPSWRDEHVEVAYLSVEVTRVDSASVHMRLEGRIRNHAHGTWAVRAFQPPVADNDRGFDARLLGFLTYDRSEAAFIRFDVLAIGTRWGGTEHNGRYDDLAPAPMGVLFELAGSLPRDRTPPHANLADYFEVLSAEC